MGTRTLRSRVLTALTLLAVVLAVDGCLFSHKPKPPPPPSELKPAKTHLNVAAHGNVNPDDNGRPSPVVLRVYQLKDDAAFKDAEFFALFDKEQATLGASLVGRKEFVLAPGDHQNVDYPILEDTRFVAVAAGFRDIRNAAWRALTVAPKRAYKDIVKENSVAVTVDKSRVTLAVSD